MSGRRTKAHNERSRRRHYRHRKQDFTLNTWVDEVGARAKTTLEVSTELAPPRWGGFLGVDGKAITIAGEECCLLVGVDHQTQDIVHSFVCEKEAGEEFAKLVIETKLDAGYPLKGLVTDYGKGFVNAHECISR